MCSLLVLKHRCFRSVTRVFWDHGVNSVCVQNRVLGEDGKSIDKVVNL